MEFITGWKDILRPIRDGYRHLFPSPDTGPTPEEREQRRRLDLLKGFTYFDTFDQLEAWTEIGSSSISRANTPLLARPSLSSANREQKANVLICHDYAGNYHDYESASAIGVDEEAYCCEYLQYVESFVYFSHKLVCVPPPSWTNTLHRNGVKVYGTLLMESQTKDIERLLQFVSDSKGERTAIDFPLATQLSHIARHYGFDGWLINIEKAFRQSEWDPSRLRGFLHQLKELLGPTRELIWYDALTVNNKIVYQNGLSSANIAFATTCGAVLTNYCWTEDKVKSSKQVALKNGVAFEKVYFGIDVWAQNTVDFGLPRTTYPEIKGGGSNTGIAVNKLADSGLSAGIFAPAWSFEHFPGHGRNVERVMWEGEALWNGATCSCRGDAAARHPANPTQCIIRSASHYAAGSETFFYTDFSRAFATNKKKEAQRLYSGKQLHSQLGSQSVLPQLPHLRTYNDHNLPIDGVISRLKSHGRQASLCLDGARYSSNSIQRDQLFARELPLFKLDMPADGSLQLTLLCTYFLNIPEAVTSIYMRFTSGTRFVPLKDSTGLQTVDCEIEPGHDKHKNPRLEELGVRIWSNPFSESVDQILEIYEIRIIPRSQLAVERSYLLEDVKIEKQGDGDTENWILRWSYQDDRIENDVSEFAVSKTPFSDVTGPFSYFTIKIDSFELGRAYALEHVLPKTLIEGFTEDSVKVTLVGVGFDGRELARCELGSVHTHNGMKD